MDKPVLCLSTGRRATVMPYSDRSLEVYRISSVEVRRELDGALGSVSLSIYSIQLVEGCPRSGPLLVPLLDHELLGQDDHPQGVGVHATGSSMPMYVCPIWKFEGQFCDLGHLQASIIRHQS